MVSIKESDEYLSADVEICVHMITFVTLWKLKKFSDSGEYLETAAGILNKIIQGFAESKMSKNSSQNLYCLIVMSLAGLKVTVENDVKAAIDTCEDCKVQLEENTLCFKLLSDFVSRISMKNLPQEDWLITDIYQKVLFVTTFMPLISPSTPLVKVSELEEEKDRGSSYSEDVKSVNSNRGISSKERLDSSRISRRGFKSTPRSNMIKPWWESNKIIDHPIATSKNREYRTDKQFRSEPRRYRNSAIQQDNKIKFSPALIAPKLSKPFSKESFYTDATREKEIREPLREDPMNDKELIMFEFNPGYEQSTGEYQVQLVPLTMFKTRTNMTKERPLSNFNIFRPVT